MLIGQYLCHRDRLVWTHTCKRFRIYTPILMAPFKELGERIYCWPYIDPYLILTDASHVLKGQHLPWVRRCFEMMIGYFGSPELYEFFREHFDLIMTSPPVRKYFLHSHIKQIHYQHFTYKDTHQCHMYQRCLIRENTLRWVSNSDLPVYLEVVDWRQVLENLCNNKYQVPWRHGNMRPWHWCNMSMMNYLYLQTHTNPDVDPAIARIIRQHYRPTQEQVYKAVRMYITSNYWLIFQDDWELLLGLLLKEFPLLKPYQQRTKRLFRNHKECHQFRPLLKAEVFPFDI